MAPQERYDREILFRTLVDSYHARDQEKGGGS